MKDCWRSKRFCKTEISASFTRPWSCVTEFCATVFSVAGGLGVDAGLDGVVFEVDTNWLGDEDVGVWLDDFGADGGGAFAGVIDDGNDGPVVLWRCGGEAVIALLCTWTGARLATSSFPGGVVVAVGAPACSPTNSRTSATYLPSVICSSSQPCGVIVALDIVVPAGAMRGRTAVTPPAMVATATRAPASCLVRRGRLASRACLVCVAGPSLLMTMPAGRRPGLRAYVP